MKEKGWVWPRRGGDRCGGDRGAGVNALIYRICHRRHVCYKFPGCSNSHNEVADCTVSYQHFGVQEHCWERLSDLQSESLEARLQATKHYLNANVTLTLTKPRFCCRGIVSESFELEAEHQRHHLWLVITQNLQPWYKHLWSSLSMQPSSSSSS